MDRLQYSITFCLSTLTFCREEMILVRKMHASARSLLFVYLVAEIVGELEGEGADTDIIGGDDIVFALTEENHIFIPTRILSVRRRRF